MLSKTTVEGVGLTNVNLESCSYQILTSMGELESLGDNQA
jgi:hypothetical protein